MLLKQLKTSILTLGILILGTGVLYPVGITTIGQLFFPRTANGSLIYAKDGKLVGSHLIGQPFDDPKYFWSRPSATAPFPYNAASSSGSNFGPTNDALLKSVRDRIEALRKADPGNNDPIPVDLVTASASGLDPEISPAAALYQARRVARLRGLSESNLKKMIERHTARPLFGFLGEPGVNVLELNLELDRLAKHL